MSTRPSPPSTELSAGGGGGAPPAPFAAGEWFKYHALGNDYLVMDGVGRATPTTAEVVQICARHLGVGSDGLLWRVPAPEGADAGLRIFNPDGSEAEKSGNGLRIFARYLLDVGLVRTPRFRIAVGREVVDCSLWAKDGALAAPPGAGRPAAIATIRTSMGEAKFLGAGVGMLEAQAPTERMALQVLDRVLDVTCVGLGNPHCVVFGQPLTRELLLALGPAIERHPLFTRRINVQLVEVVARDALRILIWERGAGETLASGSSSCAAAAAARRRNLVDENVTVSMPGGQVQVGLPARGPLELQGPAEPIARGHLWAAG